MKISPKQISNKRNRNIKFNPGECLGWSIKNVKAAKIKEQIP